MQIMLVQGQAFRWQDSEVIRERFYNLGVVHSSNYIDTDGQVIMAINQAQLPTSGGGFRNGRRASVSATELCSYDTCKLPNAIGTQSQMVFLAMRKTRRIPHKNMLCHPHSLYVPSWTYEPGETILCTVS